MEEKQIFHSAKLKETFFFFSPKTEFTNHYPSHPEYYQSCQEKEISVETAFYWEMWNGNKLVPLQYVQHLI